MLAIALCVASLARAESQHEDERLRVAMAHYQRVDIRPDLSTLPATERRALANLVEGCRVLDALFVRQVWGGNAGVLERLVVDSSDLGRQRLAWFRWNKGPWSINDRDEPFLPGIPKKPEAGTFYPSDSTKEEIEKWVASLSSEARKSAMSPYSVIRRDRGGTLVTVPYSVEYQPELSRLSELLREAAANTAQPSLKAFLEMRARAFGSNAYTESDAALVTLDSTIDAALGPFESDEDTWLGTKTAFECMVSILDENSTTSVAALSAQLPLLYQRLPVAAELRGPLPPRPQPILVMNMVVAGGYADQASLIAGYGLPDDAEAIACVGTRTAVFRSTLQARSPTITAISERALQARQPHPTIEDVIFDIAAVRMMDGLGPKVVSRTSRPVAEALGAEMARSNQLRSMLLELWALDDFVARHVISKERADPLRTTFVVLMLDRARGRAMKGSATSSSVAIFNRLLADGAARITREATIDLDASKFAASVRTQLGDVLSAQASGNPSWFTSFFARGAVLGPDLNRVLAKLDGLPLAVWPAFVAAEQMH